MLAQLQVSVPPTVPAVMGAQLIVEALARLDDLVAEGQPEDGVIYAEKIDKAEARIDWTRPAKELDCHIRGLSPFPGAYFEIIRKGKPERASLVRSDDL